MAGILTAAEISKLKADQRRAYLQPYVSQAAAANGIPPQLLDAILWRESRYNPLAVGVPVKGQRAAGISQFMPYTAPNYGLRGIGTKNDERFDPYKAINASAKFTGELYKKAGGDWGKVGIGYFAGPGKITTPYERQGPGTKDYYNYLAKAQRSNGVDLPTNNKQSMYSMAPTMTNSAITSLTAAPVGNSRNTSVYDLSELTYNIPQQTSVPNLVSPQLFAPAVGGPTTLVTRI